VIFVGNLRFPYDPSLFLGNALGNALGNDLGYDLGYDLGI